MYVTLLQNAAVLVALSTLYGLLARLRRDERAVGIRLLSGLLFGAVAIAGMLLPFRYQTGIIYDGRSIVLAVAGLFGGGSGGAVAIMVAGVYRAFVGGAGVWAGLATIVVCTSLGVGLRRMYGDRPERVGVLPLYALGVAAHVAMLACQMLLPWSRFTDVIGRLWLPVLLIFPLATLIIGLLLRTEERRIRVAYELAESRDRLDRMASRLKALVWTSSADGKTVRDVNQAVESIYGISAEELRADAALWLEKVHPSDRAQVEAGLREIPERGQVQLEYRIVRPDGGVCWVSDHRSLIYDAKGNLAGMGGIATDITDSVNIAREHRELQAQVLQSQKMEAVGRLAGGIAHDFNNLLTVINSYASMAVDELKEEDRMRGDILEILEAGRRAAELTRQLLAFSRRQVMELRTLDLNEVVTEMQKMLARLIGEHIELRTRLADDLWPVRADPVQLQQVLMNLVVNARDAMPQGGVLVVETRNESVTEDGAGGPDSPKTGEYAVLTVADTGVGMDEATRERIFEPFFTTKAKGLGTGLGLSTVYGIVSQSNGYVQVRSEPGATTFLIYLPRTAEAPQVCESSFEGS